MNVMFTEHVVYLKQCCCRPQREEILREIIAKKLPPSVKARRIKSILSSNTGWDRISHQKSSVRTVSVFEGKE